MAGSREKRLESGAPGGRGRFHPARAGLLSCPQAVEKAIKAVLLSRQVGFPLTHDIEELLELVEESGFPVPKAVENAGLLTPYAVETRYHGYWPDVTEPDVEEALQTAETVLSWANSLLPASGGEKQ